MIIGISGKIGSGKDTVGEIIQYLTSPNVGSKGTYEECKQNGFVYDVVFENRKFADKLKDMVCMMLGCTRERLEDRDFKEGILGTEWWYYKLQGHFKKDFDLISYEGFENTRPDHELIKTTPRLLLQLLGTDCGRDILHPNIWVNATMSDYIPERTRLDILDTSNGDRTVLEQGESKWIITDMRFENEADAVINAGGIAIRINRGNEVRENEHASETGLDNYDNWDEVIENNGTISDLVEKVRIILKKYNII